MKWFRKQGGYREQEYREAGFSVRITQVVREAVVIRYSRKSVVLRLSGERIGGDWEGISVCVDQEMTPAELGRMVADLEAAFKSMRYEYVITRSLGYDAVREDERRWAEAEIRNMGYEITLSAGQPVIRRVQGENQLGAERTKNQVARLKSLLESCSGKRQRIVILAQSKVL